MGNPLFQRDILSIKDLSLTDIRTILDTASRLKKQPMQNLIRDKLVAHCFFEPSTRTRLSFESATLRLGGKTLGFSSDEGLSIQKGETLSDTMKVISAYADLIVMRHPVEGSARFAAEIADIPIINAGDGANQHPSQALVDLFTIEECQGRVDGLSIGLVGDLKFGRTIHSFAEACMFFDVRLYLVAPDMLVLPDYICDALKKRGVRFSFHQKLEEVIPKVDILYLTRIQAERFGAHDYPRIQNQYHLTPALLNKVKPNLKILHPLPRVHEIDIEVDQTPYAHYFTQASNGVFVREALLALLLNEQLP